MGKQKEIAQALGVTEGGVSQWMKRAREEGGEGLKHNPPPGALPRLNETQRTRLKELMSRDAEVYGFGGKVCRCARVAELIRKEFGVGYHPAHLSRLLRALGLSLQKPMRRANQRETRRLSSAGNKSVGQS